ncbi:hypothetical protein [Flavimarina sp. Hel_I_48]|uniref:hypothetical protein n=1 Tax=Flavimarina sp. Hel_I_48 TaxID=1392488 RepID=UPI0004DFC171|nr:hypothetical protein [Flavimarina sp. Hel_I_48]
MNYQKTLIHFMVVLALVGFVVSSVFMFYQSFSILDDGILPSDYMKDMNNAVVYITSLLTALVGGIVAAAFGINPSGNMKVPTKTNKLHALGALTRSPPPGRDKNRTKYGFFYALAYILIGVTAVVIWIILESEATQGVANMATSFLGMMVPIVASFFSGTQTATTDPDTH